MNFLANEKEKGTGGGTCGGLRVLHCRVNFAEYLVSLLYNIIGGDDDDDDDDEFGVCG